MEDPKALAHKWLMWDKNTKTRKEVQNRIDSDDVEKLSALMCGELSFGTAGIRTNMSAGFARLNDLTVIQISHGFAKHLIEETSSKSSKSIVIGYDIRHNSERFAMLAANVMAKNGIKVFLFGDYVPTPIVSFAVVELKCDAGLMITASHNPKDDNGYKAYWSNGAQILSPHDKMICELKLDLKGSKRPVGEILIQVLLSSYWLEENTVLKPDLQMLFSADGILEKYYENESSMSYYKEINKNSSLKFTYSAFHGVGTKFFKTMAQKFCIPAEKIVFVKEQCDPNPEFSTVEKPNPEEGEKVLKLCFTTADANDSKVLLVNDPDADRLQLAEKQPDGKWKVFTGNEMGTLLTWWTWKNWRERNPKADLSQVYVLNSVVTSQFAATMASAEGFKQDVSLTGFKWIGNMADDLKREGKTVILMWEESIGFSVGSTLDKDGISAACVFAEIANWLCAAEQHKTLQQKLIEIYEQYGYHITRNSYLEEQSTGTIPKIFMDLRENHPSYTEKIGKYAVRYVCDPTMNYDNSKHGNKSLLPKSSSDMITYTLENGSIITVRGSGTEPKIKYYIEYRTEPGTKPDEQLLKQLEEDVVTSLLDPKKYNLKRKN